MPVLFMDAGQLTARLDLEMPQEMPDGQGGTVTAYMVIGALWARIEPVAATFAERADGELFTVTHRIWVRYRDDLGFGLGLGPGFGLGLGMRFRKGGRVFTIRALNDPDETRRYLVYRCEEERT